jgi:hypothetical protein
LVLALASLGAPVARSSEPALPPPLARPVDFVGEVLPLLTSRCGHCHGEDAQEGRLRLDARALFFRGGLSGPVVVPGDSGRSLLIRRVTGLDGRKRMPLEEAPLADDQVALLRAWIDQGAKWPEGAGSPATALKTHWAYRPPRPVRPPPVRGVQWLENAIDALVLAPLEAEGIAPSPPLDRPRLLRRLALDLTGLPPTPQEVAAFVADPAPDAYERAVDRLLASPRYGERWATPWLDLARYADSNGFQRDGFRTSWPYRDWVIRALNADLPFDQFTIEQLAGDLLPDPTPSQRIATGFHRCTPVNVEAGTDEEENRVNQVVDRVNVTATVWLGTTLECCQCHHHKYDPFTQRDYYQLFAFFNHTPKETYPRTAGSAALEFGGPEMPLPMSQELAERRQQLLAQKQALQQQLAAHLAQPLDAEALAAALAGLGQPSDPPLPANVQRILALDPSRRTPAQWAVLRKHVLRQQPQAQELAQKIARLDQELAGLQPPRALVMQELDTPRRTTIFLRGDFLSPGEEVRPDTPACLPPMDPSWPRNRLGLAQWLVASTNPLTPRVQANRAWAQFFGRGLVETLEDFGSQAEPPSHPALLDWLAVELRDRGWSLKLLHRRIVESATYRQSSALRPELAARDPENRLLARGPRQRLPAETIRDQALAVSGLLSSKMGGPPVFPPQPEGLWRITGLVDNTYRTSQGEDRYRRAVYTIWRRSAPYPSLAVFDAPDRAACTVRRPHSNTPLQALTLLNDPVFVELAAALADRVLREAPLDDAARCTWAVQIVLSRPPRQAELAELKRLVDRSRARYARDEPAARAVVAGHAWTCADLPAAERAAWFEVAHVLLNLDETISKP